MASVPILIAAHVCSMLGFATFAALLPQLRDAWSLTNAEAGIVGGMFFAGYIVSVSSWTALTDRGDARKVYAAASLVAAAGSAGFGWLARGFASGMFFQALLGVGIAGTYMPGLRLLSDRVSPARQSRSIAFYTASFGVGTALSLALAGAVASRAGWKAAFLVAAAGPVVAGMLVLALIRPIARPGPPAHVPALIPFASWGPILRQRETAGYVRGIRGALPRAVRVAQLDGRLPHLRREPSCQRVPLERADHRRGGESHVRSRFHRRQRGGAARRAAPMDPAGDRARRAPAGSCSASPRGGTGRWC